jgi:hypothetical protein
MRLLDTWRHKLEFFMGDNVPTYAILSHTWEKDEVLFEHMRDAPPSLMEMEGWKKVQYACAQARADGYEYVWIDTCCIDKSSSAELSEAINSMFRWYLRAAICYAYLADVNDTVPEAHFEKSRWFTRGWTLQELIAPSNVVFYDRAWNPITSRQGLSTAQLGAIMRVTNLPESVLQRDDEEARGCHIPNDTFPEHDFEAQVCRRCSQREGLLAVLDTISSAERMSWAARRETTRPEDRAYSLLGLFGITMPLLYGEGSRAFTRLQEEILKLSDDQSIFAFSRPAGDLREGVLADSPDMFADNQITRLTEVYRKDAHEIDESLIYEVTARSVTMDMLVCPCRISQQIAGGSLESYYQIGILACAYKYDLMSRPAIILDTAFALAKERQSWKRFDSQTLLRVSPIDVCKPETDTRSPVVLSGSQGLPRFTRPKHFYVYDVHQARFEVVRLLLTKSPPSPSPRSELWDFDTHKALSPAAVVRLFDLRYRCLVVAPGKGVPRIGNPIPGVFSSDPSAITSPSNQFYIPPTAIEDFRMSVGATAYDVLGVLLLYHPSADEPLLVLWGDLWGGTRERDVTLPTACYSPSPEPNSSVVVIEKYPSKPWGKILSAAELNGWPAMDFSRSSAHHVYSWITRKGNAEIVACSLNKIKCDRDSGLEHKVAVKKNDWLGLPLYEIEVTLTPC